MALELAASMARYPAGWLLAREDGGQVSPKELARQVRLARATVPSLPAGFRFHDLRHFYASLLIHKGADLKVVQARLRHRSAKTTLDVYGHLWPDQDESTRAMVEELFSLRIADDLRTNAALP
jgi:integrase